MRIMKLAKYRLKAQVERDEVKAGVGEEPDGAIIDAGGALHHLVRRETHGGRNSVSVCPWLTMIC